MVVAKNIDLLPVYYHPDLFVDHPMVRFRIIRLLPSATRRCTDLDQLHGVL